MKKISAVALLLLTVVLSVPLKAQFIRITDSQGKPLEQKDYTDVTGTPYLSKDWGTGSVVFDNGSAAKDMQLKYNLMDDQLTFKSEKGEELLFADPVKEFTVTYTDNESGQTLTNTFRKGFNGIERTTPSSYFEVLGDGKTQLLKKTTISIIMSQEWNSASKVKNFKDNTKYYIYKDGLATPVKKDKKAMLAILADKSQQLDAFATAQKINFKSDADLGKLITYYNTL